MGSHNKEQVSWVSCDECGKWRRIPQSEDQLVDVHWTCSLSPDPTFNACSVPQEFEDDVIDEMIAQDEGAEEPEEPEEHEEHGKKKARRPTIWQQVSANLYTHRERNSYNDDETMVCGCSRDQVVPCGEGCINRELFQECSEVYCPHGSRCTNRRFQLKQYAPLDVLRAGRKGFGLFAKEDMAAGTFLIEYVGEVLEEEEYERRKQFYEKSHQRHYYFMNIGNGETVDATRKGGVGRFINHSCEPNCETQKWTVNGEVTIGLFTKLDVTAGTELTFDYNFQRYGDKPVKCLCGTPSCRGIIGGERETADSLGVEVTEVDEEEDWEPIMVTEADEDDILVQILEREVGLGWENGWSPSLQSKVEALARRTGVELPVPDIDGSFDVAFLKSAARAAMATVNASRKPKIKGPKALRRAVDPDWCEQPSDGTKDAKGPKDPPAGKRSSGPISRSALGAKGASKRRTASLIPLKKVVIDRIEFQPAKNSEVQRHLFEMWTPSGRLEDTTKAGVNKFLQLFSLCVLDNRVTTERRVQFRCIDLRCLIDTVVRTDGYQAKHLFIRQGLLRQLFKIMVSKKDGLVEQEVTVYRKALKMLGTLPFESEHLLEKLNASTSFSDILKDFAAHPDYELKHNASALLRKWSLPFPTTARRPDRDGNSYREDRFERSDSYQRPHESSKRIRAWEENGNGKRESDVYDRRPREWSGDRDTYVGTDYGRNQFGRDGGDRLDQIGFRNGHGRNEDPAGKGIGVVVGQGGWGNEPSASAPPPPAGPKFSPMTDEDQEEGVVIVGADNDAEEDVFAHVTGNLIMDPFDEANYAEDAGQVAMVIVSTRAWETPYDPDFEDFVTSCCRKELSKHGSSQLSRAEADQMFSKVRKKVINGEKSAYDDRAARSAPQHVLSGKKVELRVRDFVKESVKRVMAAKQQQ